MPLKDLDQLLTEIDAAVRRDNSRAQAKTTAPGLNAVLTSLATELISLPQQTAPITVEQDLGSDSAAAVPSVAAVNAALLAAAAADEQRHTPYLFQVGISSADGTNPPGAPGVARLSVVQARYLVENYGSAVSLATDEVNGHSHVISVSYNSSTNEFVVNDGPSDGQEVAHQAWLVGYGRPTAALEFVFEAGFADALTRTMGPRQAATYQSEQHQNVASVSYQVNGAAASLPLALAAGDVLRVALTRTDPARGAVLALLS